MTNLDALENGLLTYISPNSTLKVATTYEGKIWGNMNPFFSTSDKEKDIIKSNDHKLSDYLETKTAFVLTTPPEDTLMNLNIETFSSLSLRNKPDDSGYKYIPLRANAIIAETILDNPYEIIFAPADCAILVIKPLDTNVTIAIHIGSPQTLQGIHLKALKLAKALYPKISWENIESYVTPYICKTHYTISEDSYNLFLKTFRNQQLLAKYTKETTHPLFKGKRYNIDFMGIVKSELEMQFGITNILESGLCTYEEAEKGNLFSHELAQEMEQKEDNTHTPNKYKGAFNVAVRI